MLIGVAQAQTNVFGKYNYKDSLRFEKYKNNAAGDSVLTTDSTGRLHLTRGTSLADFIQNQTSANQNASFRISGKMLQNYSTQDSVINKFLNTQTTTGINRVDFFKFLLSSNYTNSGLGSLRNRYIGIEIDDSIKGLKATSSVGAIPINVRLYRYSSVDSGGASGGESAIALFSGNYTQGPLLPRVARVNDLTAVGSNVFINGGTVQQFHGLSTNVQVSRDTAKVTIEQSLIGTYNNFLLGWYGAPTTTIPEVNGYYFYPQVETPITVTTVKGLNIQNGALNGTITNRWGAYIENGYKNYFGGRSLFGTTTDDGTNQVQVVGSTKTSSLAVVSDAQVDGLINAMNINVRSGHSITLNNAAASHYYSIFNNLNDLVFNSDGTEKLRLTLSGNMVLNGADNGFDRFQDNGTALITDTLKARGFFEFSGPRTQKWILQANPAIGRTVGFLKASDTTALTVPATVSGVSFIPSVFLGPVYKMRNSSGAANIGGLFIQPSIDSSDFAAPVDPLFGSWNQVFRSYPQDLSQSGRVYGTVINYGHLQPLPTNSLSTIIRGISMQGTISGGKVTDHFGIWNQLGIGNGTTDSNVVVTNSYGYNSSITIGKASGNVVTVGSVYSIYNAGVAVGATATVTTKWGLYFQDASLSSYHAGRFLIGNNADDGSHLLQVNGDGSFNGVFIGKGAGTNSSNTILGVGSLSSNVTAINSTAVGYQSLLNSTDGRNTAVGSGALRGATTATYNTAVGADALRVNVLGGQNTAIGYRAGFSHTTSDNNIFIGFTTQFSQTSGNGNVVIGNIDLGNITDNIAIGSGSAAATRIRFDGSSWNLYYRTNINNAPDDGYTALNVLGASKHSDTAKFANLVDVSTSAMIVRNLNRFNGSTILGFGHVVDSSQVSMPSTSGSAIAASFIATPRYRMTNSSGATNFTGIYTAPKVDTATFASTIYSVSGSWNELYRSYPMDNSQTAREYGSVISYGHIYTLPTTATTTIARGAMISGSVQSGTISALSSIYISTNVGASANDSNATVTTLYGLDFSIPTIGKASGNVATVGDYRAINHPGLSIGVTGTVTNRWGLYFSEATMKSYLAGNLLLGTSTDDGTSKLQVLGISKLNGRVNVNGATDNANIALNVNGTFNSYNFSSAGTTSNTSLTLGSTSVMIFNGGAGITWTLDNPSGNNKYYYIKNAGSSALTVAAYSGTNIIDNSNASVSTISVAVGATVILWHDGNVKTYQFK